MVLLTPLRRPALLYCRHEYPDACPRTETVSVTQEQYRTEEIGYGKCTDMIGLLPLFFRVPCASCAALSAVSST